MAHYFRRIVSGNQARFKDHDLKIELNLVYVTDQVIIMGYPASGIEGLYRNHKKDAVKFLESRHGNNYWVFNFCPTRERSYDASIFGGRVSRYPFPDHHPPPLALMPLVAREICTWISGSSDSVAVLHCKAGKGRSGMMACAYLLSLDELPVPPQLERSYTAKQWARRRTNHAIETLPPDEKHPNVSSPISSPMNVGITSNSNQLPVTNLILDGDAGLPPCGVSTSLPVITAPVSPTNPEKSFTDALKGVLDLHSMCRMKATTNSTEDKEMNATQGVSVPSQRRFLYYWALLLAHSAPKHMWDTEPPVLVQSVPYQFQRLEQATSPRPKVHLMQITLRMRKASKIKIGIVKAASLIIGKISASGKTKKYSSLHQLWASISKYDDVLIDRLEKWEVYMRDPQGNMGKGRLFSPGVLQGEDAKIFEGGNWDKEKMLQSFAHFGVVDKGVEDMDGKAHTYVLRPMSDKRWASLQHDLEVDSDVDASRIINSKARSTINAQVRVTVGDMKKKVSAIGIKGVLLDAGREVRVKLYMGQVVMGWVCFVPTFHMPQPPPSSNLSRKEGQKTHLLFTRNEIDSLVGIGNDIGDVELEMEWVIPEVSASEVTKQ